MVTVPKMDRGKMLESLYSAVDKHAGVCVMASDWMIVQVNDALCRMSGYRADEIIGGNPMMFKSDAHSQKFYEDISRTLRAGQTWSGMICNQGKGGRQYWTQSTISPFVGDEGATYFIAIETESSALHEIEVLAQNSEQSLLQARKFVSDIIDGGPVPTFVIDINHVITHWNKGCEAITGYPASSMVGTRDHWKAFYPEERPLMADLIADGADETEIKAYYQDRYRQSGVVNGAYEAEGFFPAYGVGGRWLNFTAAPLRDTQGTIVGAIETLQDITERVKAETAARAASEMLEIQVEERTAELTHKCEELSDLNTQLGAMQEQLLHSEKMASIGQLAAGVAHEINNPIGYVQSNLNALERYTQDVFRLLRVCGGMDSSQFSPDIFVEELHRLRKEIDFEYLQNDIAELLKESQEGIGRVRKIVLDLRNFSRIDPKQAWEMADLKEGLESTLNMVFNEIKYKADVVKEYGELPPVECVPSQINQVFMNLLVNAAQAMDGSKRGTIFLRTGVEGDRVWVEVADTGSGIPPENLKRIFDPFFTTKPVGKGTGLGLSLSYGIVKKHGGTIDVRSTPGQGTTFRVTLLQRQIMPANTPETLQSG